MDHASPIPSSWFQDEERFTARVISSPVVGQERPSHGTTQRAGCLKHPNVGSSRGGLTMCNSSTLIESAAETAARLTAVEVRSR